MLVYNSLLQAELEYINSLAKHTSCKRKGVGCSLISIKDPTFFIRKFNGPASDKIVCSNEVGNCGCVHAEVRAILHGLKNNYFAPFIMLCSYSPCTNCSNLIILTDIIHTVVYDILTEHDKRGLEHLKGSGIECYNMLEVAQWTEGLNISWLDLNPRFGTSQR